MKKARRKRHPVLAGFLLTFGIIVCQASTSAWNTDPAPPVPPHQPGDIPMTMKVRSTAFADKAPIPKKFTGDGEDISPEISWTQVPESAKELALVCDDPHAPKPQPWVHWVVYRIPASMNGLPEALQPTQAPGELKDIAQGRNSWGGVGYRGPAPPPGHGVHNYHFKVYALSEPLKLAPGADKDALLEAMKGKIVAQGELVGTFQRQ